VNFVSTSLDGAVSSEIPSISKSPSKHGYQAYLGSNCYICIKKIGSDVPKHKNSKTCILIQPRAHVCDSWLRFIVLFVVLVVFFGL
jgi:hypothetical protein